MILKKVEKYYLQNTLSFDVGLSKNNHRLFRQSVPRKLYAEQRSGRVVSLSLDVIDSNGSLAHANRTVTDDNIVTGDKNRVYLLNSRELVAMRFSSRKPMFLKYNILVLVLVFFFMIKTMECL